MNNETPNKLEQLIVKRNELLTRVESIKEDFRKGLDKDSSEQAIELENAEVLDEIARVSMEELGKVNVAIEQLEKANTGL